jgi:hypothetical protein
MSSLNLANNDNLWKLVDQADENDVGFSLVLHKIKKKWAKKLKQKFDKEEKVGTHLLVSGGNYTCDMLLPFMLRRIQKSFPMFSIKLGLAEFEKYEDLREIGHDIILSGYYSDNDFRTFKEGLNDNGFDTSRSCFFEDAAYIGCSKLVCELYTSQHILTNFPLLGGRFYRQSNSLEQITYKYGITPEGREAENAPIFSDKHYYNYLLMRYSVGLWMTFKSSPYDNGVYLLEGVRNSSLMRHVIFKRKYAKIGAKLTKQVQIFMRKDLQDDRNRATQGGIQRFRV